MSDSPHRPVRLSTVDPRTGVRPERDGTDPYRYAAVDGRIFRVGRGARGWKVHEITDDRLDLIAAFCDTIADAAIAISIYLAQPDHTEGEQP